MQGFDSFLDLRRFSHQTIVVLYRNPPVFGPTAAVFSLGDSL